MLHNTYKKIICIFINNNIHSACINIQKTVYSSFLHKSGTHIFKLCVHCTVAYNVARKQILWHVRFVYMWLYIVYSYFTYSVLNKRACTRCNHMNTLICMSWYCTRKRHWTQHSLQVCFVFLICVLVAALTLCFQQWLHSDSDVSSIAHKSFS